jgi:hypothetical protein
MWLPVCWFGGGEEGRTSFLKKEAKNFYFLRGLHDAGQVLDVAAGGEIKVFWFSSSEKNPLVA